MDPIVIRTKVESDTLVLPELKGLVGKTVEIRITERPGGAGRKTPAEPEADTGPVPTLEEVRAALSKIPGSMTADFIAERGAR